MKCILIADDHPFVRACLRNILHQYPDWRVFEADNGRDAISKAEQLRPDLIVLDLSMPVMNGLEAARELKRLMPAVPLLLWTSFADSDVEGVAKAAGFNAVASKSDGSPVLLQSIRKLLPAAAWPGAPPNQPPRVHGDPAH